MGKKLTVPTPEELAGQMEFLGEQMVEEHLSQIRTTAESTVFSPEAYRQICYLLSWFISVVPFAFVFLFHYCGWFSLVNPSIIASCIIFGLRLFLVLPVHPGWPLDEMVSNGTNKLADSLRETVVLRQTQKLKPQKFLELFSANAGYLHRCYDKWKHDAQAKNADDRTNLEQAIKNIGTNIEQLLQLRDHPPLEFDSDVSDRELANFQMLLETLEKSLAKLKKQEAKEGSSLDEQIGKRVAAYMMKEELPLVRGEEHAQQVANLEMSLQMDAPLPAPDPPVPADIVEGVSEGGGIAAKKARVK